MAVGDDSKIGAHSAIAFRHETTYGTFNVTTTALHTCLPLSIGIRKEIESQKLDELTLNRGFARRVQLNNNTGGPIETFLHADENIHFLANALGGPLTFTSITSGSLYSISAGNWGSTATFTSLSLWALKGDTHSFRYSGGVINSLKLAASVGEPARLTAEFIFQDGSLGTDAIGAALSFSSAPPMTYVEGTFQYDTSEASLTSSVARPIQAFELEINNNLVSDAAARQLGSRTLSRRPPGTRRDVTLKVTQRFDTTTTYNEFIQATQGAIALKFVGASISAEYNREVTIILPKVFLNSPDPTVDGPNEVLQMELMYDCLVDNPATTTGRDIGVTVRSSRTTQL